MPFTPEQVKKLAPDARSVHAALALSDSRKWSKVGTDLEFVWGEIQGSGSTPYQTEIEISTPAFKCTCPSKKVPCKHILALLFLFNDRPALFKSEGRPTWVEEWAKSRLVSAERKARKAADPTAIPDPEAKAKRAAERVNKVNSGLVELERWLEDLIRSGLAMAQSQPYAFWENAAARLVDAQAPGLAKMVRDCSYLCNTGEGWQERLFKQVSRISLLMHAFRNIDLLPEEAQSDIRTIIGFTVSQSDVLASNSVHDRWRVLSAVTEGEEEQTLKTKRIWMIGERTNRTALVLLFAYGEAPFPHKIDAGTTIDATLSFYPGTVSFRALIQEDDSDNFQSKIESFISPFAGYKNLKDAFKSYGQAVGASPWLQSFPMTVESSRIVPTGDELNNWALIDSEDYSVPIRSKGIETWQLFSNCDGLECTIFGEWLGEKFLPLAAMRKGTQYASHQELHA